MMCPIGCTVHYGCRLREKSLMVSPRVSPREGANWKPTPLVPPAHYANFAYEDRPGGFKSPILRPDGSHMREREFRQNEAQHQDTLNRIRAGTPQGD